MAAFQNRNQVIQPICQDSDLAYAQPGKELIKMHDDFEHDNFVLKEDDYLNYSENFKLIENYVKSLVGSKVILFIGYSFNDPDTKQIFTWVKNTLKDDVQRAYMLEVGQNFDRNVEQYYRNLGVNVIFTKSWFRDLHSPSNNLEHALDLILRDTEDLYGALIVVGFVGMFLFQIFENIAMTIGLMPVTGITLPFLSGGGTSVIASMISVGLILNVGVNSKGIKF